MNTDSLGNVDKHRLDEEFEIQPRLIQKFGVALADAEKDLADAKADLELIHAELSLAIRKDPEKYDVGKLSEDGVKSAIRLDQGFIDAAKLLREAEHKVDLLKASMRTLDHRRSTLENLVVLHGRDYFSKPRILPEVEESTRESMQDRKKRKIRSH